MLKFFFVYFILLAQDNNSFDLNSLDNIEIKHSKIRDEVYDLNQIIEVQALTIKTFENEIISIDKEINIKKEFLNQRLKILFMFLVPDELYFLYSLKSFEDYELLSSYSKYLYKKDIEEIETLKAKIYKLNDLRLLLEKEIQNIDEKKVKLSLKLEELETLLTQKKSILKKIENDKNKMKAYKKRINTSDEKISKILKSKDDNKTNEYKNLFTLKKPIKAKVRILKKYGKQWDSNLRNWTFNNGILLKTSYGESVYAVKKGTVKFSGWLPGYGKVLILAHEEGLFSVYAHLLRSLVNEGSMVEASEIIAYTGDTGSVKEASLYFELRFYANNIDPSYLFD